MTQKRLKGRFLIKAKTAQEFATENPVLLNNELVIEKDTGKKKLGDGTTKYNSLRYLESIDWDEISNKPAEFTPKTHTHLYAASSTAGGAATKAIADGNGNTITSTYAKTSAIPTKVSQLANDEGYLTSHQDISGKANKATTLAGYGITDANITNGKITLGDNSITPLTQHQSLAEYVKSTDLAAVATSGSYTDLKDKPTVPDISNKADKATTLAGYGITDAKIVNDTITLGSNSITPITSHQSLAEYVTTSAMNTALEGKANTATTLAGYGITDAKISNGTITLGSSSITPLTSHQDLSNYVTLDETQTISGYKTFSESCSFTGKQLWLSADTAFTWYSGSPNNIRGVLTNVSFSGKAASADKLATDAGDEKTPVYFKNGIPVACTVANSMPISKDDSSTAEFGYEIINNNLFLLSSTEDGAEIATLNANIPWSNIQDAPQIFSIIYPEYTTGLYRFCTNKYGQVTGAVAATGDDISALNPTAAKVTATTDSANYTGYIPFVSGTGAQVVKTNTNLTFNPYTGTLSATKVLNATYNDYAEFFPRGEETEAGDIIALDLSSDQEQYVKATKNSIVAGVHSDEYAHLIGGEIAPENEDFVSYNMKKYIPVSLAGRVSVKVKGKVERGDYIIASDEPGIGIASKDPINQRAIVGYAVEASDNEKIKRIRVRVKGG